MGISDRQRRLQNLALWRNFFRTANSWPERLAWTVALLAMVLASAALDQWSGRDIQLFILYLIPITLGLWKLGFPAGVVIMLLCAVLEYTGDRVLLPGIAWQVPMINAMVHFFVFLLSGYGAWKIREMGNALAELSLIDPLTGMHNRRAFMIHGREAVERMRRNNQALSVLFIDLDNFKTVNDRHGHDVGDQLLKQVAKSMRGRFRQTDFPARLGGDEFAVILPDTSGDAASKLAETLQAALRKFCAQKKYPVSASIGVATFHKAPREFDQILKCADQLMYEVKNSSKDAVCQQDFGDSAAKAPALKESA